ncbi:MAG TPA: hypothetical protein VES88_11490 [Gemmatimonadaceae bacterium]|nr:hypothetical protein [Gemmatimonadaceae bacterium]
MKTSTEKAPPAAALLAVVISVIDNGSEFAETLKKIPHPDDPPLLEVGLAFRVSAKAVAPNAERIDAQTSARSILPPTTELKN